MLEQPAHPVQIGPVQLAVEHRRQPRRRQPAALHHRLHRRDCSLSPRVSCDTAREPMDQTQHPREALPPVAAVSTEQAASFAILRRPRFESDRLPESRLKAFDGGMIGRLGLNPALA